MFQDDFWEGHSDPEEQEELLHAYENIKNGQPTRHLEEDDFEYIIDFFLHSNKEAEALQACDIALIYYPYSTSMHLVKAEVLFQAQRYGQALHSLDVADKLSGNLLESVLLRSDIYLAQFKFDAAADLLKERIPFFDSTEKTELMLELSDVYDENEDYEAVFDTLETILQYAPENEEALHKISFWADITGFQERSVRLHQQIVDRKPYNALAWFNLGAALQGLKKYEEAIDAYEYCIAIDEKFEAAYRNMADAYIKLNWFEKAIESLEKNLELGKPEDVIYEAMGHCFERQKDFSRARHFYREAIRLNPADDLVFFRIGETYMKEKNWEKAANSYSSALSLNRNNAACLQSLGNCLLEMNAPIEALTCFLNAIQLKPNNISNWSALLKGLYRTECYQEMLQDITAAKEALGDKPDFDFFAALALFAMGKSKEAVLHLEKGLVQSPQKVKIILDLEPELLQRKKVSSLISKYKRQKK